MCMLPREKGPCADYEQKYYFNTLSGQCEEFTYGGCNGNDNNFESLDECESTCHALIESASNSQILPINMKPKALSYDQRKKICKYPVNEGSCNGYLKRFYFNFFTKNCEAFAYTGCEGNENNFITYESCMGTCFDLEKNYTAEAIMKASKSNGMMMYPVDCRISDWSNWTECSSNECGQMGYSYRTRTILSQEKYGGIPCPANLNEKKICFKKCDAKTDKVKLDCSVKRWGPWSECKMGKSCNDGFQERMSLPIKGCPVLKEKRMCYLGPCSP
ncbi:unnamed protein product [Brachionus calyciflorus]|uniref:BPTI/Kunitz inhibitor domain-containing protein n=1 Tax=Brachionus calyciflorus TaxID=104777 RepID=A0A813ZFI3_9BILA|nr:unnamed protein product [Brachionus calyciflorus]